MKPFNNFPVLGLILFVYTTGLQSGSSFFSSFGQRGIRANLLVVGVLFIAAGLCAVAPNVWNIGPALIVGVFAGSLTNTPALASSIDAIRGVANGSPDLAGLLSAPVIGYSVTYPFGVIGVLLAFHVFERIVSREDPATSELVEEQTGHLVARSYRVTNPVAIGVEVRTMLSEDAQRVVAFSRMKRGDVL